MEMQYKEIVAFCEGKILDDIQKQHEIGKHPYQKIFLYWQCIDNICCLRSNRFSDIFLFDEPNFATLDVLSVIVAVSALDCFILVVFTTLCPNPNNGID